MLLANTCNVTKNNLPFLIATQGIAVYQYHESYISLGMSNWKLKKVFLKPLEDNFYYAKELKLYMYPAGLENTMLLYFKTKIILPEYRKKKIGIPLGGSLPFIDCRREHLPNLIATYM